MAFVVLHVVSLLELAGSWLLPRRFGLGFGFCLESGFWSGCFFGWAASERFVARTSCSLMTASAVVAHCCAQRGAKALRPSPVHPKWMRGILQQAQHPCHSPLVRVHVGLLDHNSKEGCMVPDCSHVVVLRSIEDVGQTPHDEAQFPLPCTAAAPFQVRHKADIAQRFQAGWRRGSGALTPMDGLADAKEELAILHGQLPLQLLPASCSSNSHTCAGTRQFCHRIRGGCT